MSLPWVIAALCFGWSVFMTVEMLTKEEVRGAPRGLQ